MENSNIPEAIAEGSKVITKFEEIIEKIFTARWIRKKADAEAYADERKLQTIRENPDMEIVYVNGTMNARSKEPEALLARAQARQLNEAIKQESNIENILEIAESEVKNESTASDKQIDDDWITRFFDMAKNISSNDLQIIWGKILAGEIVSPGSFSLRTLETLRNLSAEEAHLFQKAIPLFINLSTNMFLINDNELLNKYGLNYGDILKLDECGLINASSATITNKVTTNIDRFLHTKDRVSFTQGTAPNIEIEFSVYLLKRVAYELTSIIQYTPNNQFFQDCNKKIYNENKHKNLRITIHEVMELHDQSIRYNTNKLLSYTE